MGLEDLEGKSPVRRVNVPNLKLAIFIVVCEKQEI